jgi:hypothetical protein
MRPIKIDSQTGTAGAALTLTPVDVSKAKGYGVLVETTVATAAAKTFASGTAEVTEITCVADAGVKEVQTLTFPTKSAATNGDYFVVEAANGHKFAIYLDKLGTSVEPTGAIWTAIEPVNKGRANISADTTAAQVAARVETALNALTYFTDLITSDDTAADGTMTLTQVNVGPTTNPVVKNAADSGAGSITGVQTTAGVASNLNNTYIVGYEPDSATKHAFWFNVNSEGVEPTVADATMHEVVIDASATDAQVATALEAIIDDVTSWSSSATLAVITVTASTKYAMNWADDGDTEFTIDPTTPGVNNAFSIINNTITIASHGYATGLKVAATTAGTLPTGLSATDYYVIKVDASTIKLASSAANAIAGTAVNITGDGSGTHTLTPAALGGGSYKLQYSLDGTTYIDSGVTNNVTTTASFLHEKVDPMFNFVRLVWAMTAGQIAYIVTTLVKEEN